MPPTVSVVMPVYNGERYLQAAIDSIRGQTFTDFEFVIVDDGSQDDTWDILRANAAQDSRLVLLRNARNGGVLAARNRGLSAAQGVYMAVQDADDIALPERLALQAAYLDANPQVGAVGGPAQRIDANGNPQAMWRVPSGHEIIRAHLLFTSPIAHTTMMARRVLVLALGGYQYPYGVEDYDLWWRLCQASRLETLPQTLAQYRIHDDPNRITSGQAPAQLIGSQEISLRIATEIMPDGRVDEPAYKRYFMASRGRAGLLQPGDIARLQPVLDFLAADPHYRAVAGPRLLSTAQKITRQHPAEALRLLGVVQRQFGISTTEIIRKYLRVYVRESLMHKAH
jgi:GT2 family glycosyltransferase